MSGLLAPTQPQRDVTLFKMLHETSIVCRYVSHASFRYGPHYHIGVGICYCMSGHGTYTVGNQTLPFSAGNLIYFDSQTAHSVDMQGTYNRWDVCVWPDGLMSHQKNEPLRSALVNIGLMAGGVRMFSIPESDQQRFDQLFRNIREENVSRRSGFSTIILVNLIELHMLLQRLSSESAIISASDGTPVPDSQIVAILQYIEEQLPNALTINQISEQFNYHPSQIFRIIRRSTGLSPSCYIQDRRLVRAKSLLIENDLSISSIAANVGYDSAAYFCRLFRQKTGETPMEYRTRHRSV